MDGAAARVEVVVEVGDVEAAARFYERLGLRRVKAGTWEGGAYAELTDARGTRVMLVEGTGGVRVTLTVADAEAAMAAASDSGATVEVGVEAGGGGRWGRARDPWGNPFGFWSRS